MRRPRIGANAEPRTSGRPAAHKPVTADERACGGMDVGDASPGEPFLRDVDTAPDDPRRQCSAARRTLRHRRMGTAGATIVRSTGLVLSALLAPATHACFSSEAVHETSRIGPTTGGDMKPALFRILPPSLPPGGLHTQRGRWISRGCRPLHRSARHRRSLPGRDSGPWPGRACQGSRRRFEDVLHRYGCRAPAT